MSVNIVEGKDPALCAARRCQKTQTVVVAGEAFGVSFGVPLCETHAARMGDAPVTRQTNLPGISGTPPKPPPELSDCECCWHNGINEWVFHLDDYDPDDAETYVRASDALGTPAPAPVTATQDVAAHAVSLPAVVTPDVKATIASEESAAATDLAELQAFEIDSQEDLELAGELLSETQAEIKKLETMQADLLKPFKQGIKGIQDLFSGAIKRRKSIKELLKGKISDLEASLEERNRAALEAGEPQQMISTADAPGFYTKKVLEWELEDFSLVPDEYKALDTSALRILCRETKDGDMPEVPGITFQFVDRTVPQAKR